MTPPTYAAKRVTIVGFLIVAMLVTSVAAAQGPSSSDAADSDEEAKALFHAGRVAFEAQRYEDALQRWKTAYGLSGQPALKYNIGLAAERLARTDEAIAAFESYLKWEPDGRRSDEVRAKLTTLNATRKAPTPAEAANASAPQRETEPTDEPARVGGDVESDPTPWYGQWWVWTAAGVVVTGVVVGIAVGTSGDETAAPAQSNAGVSVLTLRH